MLTVIIPSKTEVFLNHTIKDVLKNATGEIEVIPVLDGYEPDELITDSRVVYIRLPKSRNTQKRHGINKAVSIARGDYVMSLDAHCMMAPGFDTQLAKDHKPNWVQIPRRNRLDAANWCLQTQSDNRPPIDYEYIMFQPLVHNRSIHGFKWDERTLSRWNIPIDDTMEFQGSCWFVSKDYYNYLGMMQTEGYKGWGQESEEWVLKVRKDGGRVISNKNTWYAHLHKGTKYGRMYWMSRQESRESYAYSYKHFVHENKDVFTKLIEDFMPLPMWPHNWKKRIYG